MNASVSTPETSDRSLKSGDSTNFASNGRHARARSMRKAAVFVGVFTIMAGISWLMLSWLATLHDKGQLLNDETVNTTLFIGVGLALVVLIPVVVSMVRTARDKIQKGEGILSTASGYLDSNTKNPLLTKDDFRTSFVGKLVNAFSRKETEPDQTAEFNSADESISHHQVEELSQTHEEASRRIKDFNSEMEDLFPRWKQRIGAYEQRVEELEKELSARDSENSELLKRQIELVNQHLNLAREKAGDETELDTEIETKPVENSMLSSEEMIGNLKSIISPKEEPETNAADKAAELTRQFRHDTETLSKEDKIKVYEERIAAMEADLAGTEAENKELTWNQLQLMQDKLAKLTGKSENETAAENTSTRPKQVAGFKTEIRRRAALRVAELNERLTKMYPDNDDRIAAYEERLAKIEQELSERTSENKELLQCQMEMAQNYYRLMQGVPSLGQGAPANDDTLSQMFGLQFDLNATQQEAARQVAKFNQDLKNNNPSSNEQFEAYRERVAELEAEVARKDQENRELYEAQLELVQYQMDHLEQTNLCDEPMGISETASRDLEPANPQEKSINEHLEAAPQIDENGVPYVRIPEYQRAIVKDEVPREIRVLLDRKPTTLRIQGVRPQKKKKRVAK